MTDMLIPHRAVVDAVAAFEATCEKQGAVDDAEGQFQDCMYAAIRAALPHLRKLENAMYTAAEVKVLTEDACRVAAEAGRRIGRKEALEDVRGALIAEGATQRAIAIVMAIQAEDMRSQPLRAVSDERSGEGEGPGVTCPDCGLTDDHKGGCPQTGEAPRPGAPG